jgi:hypothetical protein
MDHCVESQAQHIDENMPFFAVDPLTRVITIGIDARSPVNPAPVAVDLTGGITSLT